jgi:hypothetical protein
LESGFLEGSQECHHPGHSGIVSQTLIEVEEYLVFHFFGQYIIHKMIQRQERILVVCPWTKTEPVVWHQISNIIKNLMKKFNF